MSDILKEAIADAKAVRETALQNAKLALEEAFTPQLKSMLSAKLREEEKAVKGIALGAKGFVPSNPQATKFHFSPMRTSPEGLTPEETLQEEREIVKGLVKGRPLDESAWADLLARIVDTPSEQLDEFAPFVVGYADTKFEKTKAEQLFGSMAIVEQIQRAIASGNKEEIIKSLRFTRGYKEKQQFEFTRLQAEGIKNFKHVGTLMIGERYMKATWARYADLLKETIGPVYRQLQAFTDNINNYFLGVSEEEAQQGRKQYALDAIEDAEQLQVATTAAVEKIEGTP